MQSDSSLGKLLDQLVIVTWQLGDRDRQLRHSLLSINETLGDVLQRALMEACTMGYLNKKSAFIETEDFANQWQIFIYREGQEVLLSPESNIATLDLQPGERLIFHPPKLGSTSEHKLFHSDFAEERDERAPAPDPVGYEAPASEPVGYQAPVAEPVAHVEEESSSSSTWVTKILIVLLLLLLPAIAWLLLR